MITAQSCFVCLKKITWSLLLQYFLHYFKGNCWHNAIIEHHQSLMFVFHALLKNLESYPLVAIVFTVTTRTRNLRTRKKICKTLFNNCYSWQFRTALSREKIGAFMFAEIKKDRINRSKVKLHNFVCFKNYQRCSSYFFCWLFYRFQDNC